MTENGLTVALPFTTSMTDDHSPRSGRAGMNECLKLGSGEGCASVRVWVSAAGKLPDTSRPESVVQRHPGERQIAAKAAVRADRNGRSATRLLLGRPSG